MKKAALCTTALLLSLPCWAHDLGVQGETYPITEPDFRAVIMRQINGVNADKIEKHMTEQGRNFADNLPDYPLPTIQHTRTYTITPQITAEKNIYAPTLDENGNLKWEVLVKKGTTVNPLDKVRPNTAYLIINGQSKDQVEFMQTLWRAAPNYIIPMLSAGDPTVYAKDMNIPVYRASPFILRRFDLEHTPALARAGTGKDKNKLVITEFARPFTLQSALVHVDMQYLFGYPSEDEFKGASSK